MQRFFGGILGFMLLMVYWSVHDTIDSKLFGPTPAKEIATPDQAVHSVDIYPGAKVKEHQLDHNESDDGQSMWHYSWILEAPYGQATVVDFYKRRMGQPKASDEEYYAYEEVVFEKEPSGAKPGELTRVVAVANPENSASSYIFIDQLVSSNASSLSWKTRRNLIHLLILGMIGALASLPLLLKWKFGGQKVEEEPSVTFTPPPPPSVPEEAPAAAAAPALDETAFFEELQTLVAGAHPDWKISLERFELVVRRAGQAPLAVDTEPLFYLWKRPGVDRQQAITQFLGGRIK